MFFRCFGSVACMSRAGVGYLREHYALSLRQKLVAIPLWADIAIPAFPARDAVRTKHGLPQHVSIALFGGQIAEGRGVNEIIEAAALAREQNPEVLFLLVGRGPLEHLVKRYIAGGGDNLVLMGALPRDEYVTLVSACDVGIVCTVANVDVPTFPSKTLDYLRAGVPIVASVEASTDYGAFVEERGFGVAVLAGDPARLLGAIKRVLASSEGARDMVAAGRQTLKEVFDVNLAVDAMLEFAS